MINNNSEYGSNRRGVRGGSKKSQYQSGSISNAGKDCDRRTTEDARTWAIRCEDLDSVPEYGAEFHEVRMEFHSVSRARNKSGNQKGKLSQTMGNSGRKNRARNKSGNRKGKLNQTWETPVTTQLLQTPDPMPRECWSEAIRIFTADCLYGARLVSIFNKFDGVAILNFGEVREGSWVSQQVEWKMDPETHKTSGMSTILLGNMNTVK
ncbi:hypothetical protein FB451DRAFT_1182312 [Mycena latifolia]|nr:hypothetical protein FB451DRAFT_1182312 [Mycena latifolia]